MLLTLTAARGGRLSSFLMGELKMSSSLVNKLKWGDAITVNGCKRFMDWAVVPGDVICVDLDEPEPEYPAEDGEFTILYEDEYLLAADKPAGMLIHPSRSKNDGTLANFVAGYYRRTGQKCAFHPLTRLDRDTFGAVLLAKSAHVHTLLQSCGAQKTYHALVFGGPEGSSGIIDVPIARRPLPSLLRYADPSGKPSVTRYTVLRRENGITMLALEPVTGRTHQLRVHCSCSGFPILGDPQYGSPESENFSRALGLSSQLLCAKRIQLTHPITGEPLRIESKMDAALSGPVLKPEESSI